MVEFVLFGAKDDPIVIPVDALLYRPIADSKDLGTSALVVL